MARRCAQAEGLADALEQAGMAAGLRQPAAERLARVLVGVLHELPLLAALRHRHLDLVAGALRQGGGKQRPLLDLRDLPLKRW